MNFLFKAVFPDVAPNYSGTLMGISNTFANSAGFISPIIVGLLTEGNVRDDFTLTGKTNLQCFAFSKPGPDGGLRFFWPLDSTSFARQFS